MYKRLYGSEGGPELIGRWRIELRSGGVVKQVVEGKNLVVDSGKEFLASFMNSAATAASTFTMRYIAIGTDATVAAASNTALGTEAARASGTVTYTSGAIYTVVATFASGTGTGAIVEYGLFSSSTAGAMMSRDVESVINKGANDELVVTTNLTVA